MAAVALVVCRAWHRSAEESVQETRGGARSPSAKRSSSRSRRFARSCTPRTRRSSGGLSRFRESCGRLRELKAHLPLEAVLANVVRAASTCLGYRRVLLSLHDRADGVLVPRAHVGLSAEWPDLERLRLPADRFAGTPTGSAGVPASPFASLRSGTARQQARLRRPSSRRTTSSASSSSTGRSGKTPNPKTGPRVLELFATQAVTAIRLARAHETTRLGTLRDPLTGVANHGHFQETLYRELTRHERSGEKLVLLMVDLDDFKSGQRPARPPDRRRGPEGGRRPSPRLGPRDGHRRPLRRGGVRGRPSADRRGATASASPSGSGRPSRHRLSRPGSRSRSGSPSRSASPSTPRTRRRREP